MLQFPTFLYLSDQPFKTFPHPDRVGAPNNKHGCRVRLHKDFIISRGSRRETLHATWQMPLIIRPRRIGDHV